MTEPAYIGLMSGTSMDGIDAVLASFPGNCVEIHGTFSLPYSDTLRQRLTRACQNQSTPDEVGELDHELGVLFGDAAKGVIEATDLPRSVIAAIGSHGQTIRHQPSGKMPFTMQIGDPNLIAEATGITTVADFRRRDLAAGGQGAPLVPAFHRAFFGDDRANRCIVNIGGIANITWLPHAQPDQALGFDTGPGNALIDAWCLKQTGRPYDDNGHWASTGEINQALLSDMLSDAYFQRPAPKSTGKERFNLSWIETVIARHTGVPANDVQCTLVELTVRSLAMQLPQTRDVTFYVCGGGARNRFLMDRLRTALPEAAVETTAELGVDPQWVEGVAFAWLAKRTLEQQSGNLPAVTGARGKRILGAIYQA
ncbi:anhydro-N-acetylmuramic acid kinase [Marinobacter halodurans]|uniref:Anhydro-N-acetylmuramic acid kinase n=1 Tax=Marinobacter halodurans TaxID=2528979 RepID=A0ABY1ZJK1_9GAMM|nr:anhydro-N-acetylmuramic acid kinase [Marinobacter halodurans]TBW49658.1 anhydro-N-acetylmuramic acid kinase [Marinobacter halodurans]